MADHSTTTDHGRGPAGVDVRRIVLVVYPDFELLDMAGPHSVFAMANTITQRSHYDIVLASPTGGDIQSATGPVVKTVPLSGVGTKGIDTVLVAGAREAPLFDAMADDALISWVRQIKPGTRRTGSVCSGSFVLAQAGLLDGRSATTHWRVCNLLSERFPFVQVRPRDVFVVDDDVWTSAGVTTGIDLALEMVSQDLGSAVVSDVGKRLCVYIRRPGHHSQYSALWQAQHAAGNMFDTVIAWAAEHLHETIRVEDMAALAGMTERTFFRKFTQAYDVTPSKFVEGMRLDRARDLIDRGANLKQVGGQVGFKSPAGFRSAFRTRFGLSPSQYRDLANPDGVHPREPAAPAPGERSEPLLR